MDRQGWKVQARRESRGSGRSGGGAQAKVEGDCRRRAGMEKVKDAGESGAAMWRAGGRWPYKRLPQ